MSISIFSQSQINLNEISQVLRSQLGQEDMPNVLPSGQGINLGEIQSILQSQNTTQEEKLGSTESKTEGIDARAIDTILQSPIPPNLPVPEENPKGINVNELNKILGGDRQVIVPSGLPQEIKIAEPENNLSKSLRRRK